MELGSKDPQAQNSSYPKQITKNDCQRIVEYVKNLTVRTGLVTLTIKEILRDRISKVYAGVYYYDNLLVEAAAKYTTEIGRLYKG